MAEPLRKDDELTTADLASRPEVKRPPAGETRQTDETGRPKLVRSENAVESTEQKSATGIPGPSSRDVSASTPLFSESDVGDLRGRWSNVQASFVDEPRRTVEEADKLVATVMQRLAEGFANERSKLEKQWDSGDNVS